MPEIKNGFLDAEKEPACFSGLPIRVITQSPSLHQEK